MWRKLFHGYCCFSCILLVLACVAWARSYSHDEGVTSRGSFSVQTFGYTDGRFYWLIEHDRVGEDDRGPWRGYSLEPGIDKQFVPPRVADLSFSLGGLEMVLIKDRVQWITLPMWFVTLISTIRPTFWIRYLLKRKRAKQRAALGQCEKCGHDLQGQTVEKCPKCGAKDAKLK